MYLYIYVYIYISILFMINMIKVWSMNVACFDRLCIHGLPWARPIDELLHQSQPRSCPNKWPWYTLTTDHPSATGHTQATPGTESDGRLFGRHAFEPATHVSIHVDGFSQCGFITWYCSCPRENETAGWKWRPGFLLWQGDRSTVKVTSVCQWLLQWYSGWKQREGEVEYIK